MDSIDKQIADLERQLAGLRRQKLASLQSQMAALQAALEGGTEAAAPVRRTRKVKEETKGWAGELSSPKRRGRRKGKHISDEEALAALTKVVVAAGAEGISARHASEKSGVFYQRAIALMNDSFKKTGSGKWTRYTVK